MRTAPRNYINIKNTGEGEWEKSDKKTRTDRRTIKIETTYDWTRKGTE